MTPFGYAALMSQLRGRARTGDLQAALAGALHREVDFVPGGGRDRHHPGIERSPGRSDGRGLPGGIEHVGSCFHGHLLTFADTQVRRRDPAVAHVEASRDSRIDLERHLDAAAEPAGDGRRRSRPVPAAGKDRATTRRAREPSRMLISGRSPPAACRLCSRPSRRVAWIHPVRTPRCCSRQGAAR